MDTHYTNMDSDGEVYVGTHLQNHKGCKSGKENERGTKRRSGSPCESRHNEGKKRRSSEKWLKDDIQEKEKCEVKFTGQLNEENQIKDPKCLVDSPLDKKKDGVISGITFVQRERNSLSAEQPEYSETEQRLGANDEPKAKGIQKNRFTNNSPKLDEEHEDHIIAEGYKSHYDGNAKDQYTHPVKLPRYIFDMLTKVCFKIFEDKKLTDDRELQRKKGLEDVERHLKDHLDPNVRLTLFGSSVNNFGFQGSDMDICLQYESDEPPDGVNYGVEIDKVSKALEKNPIFQNVMCIRSAKVPIVKFTIRDMNLDGDISLYNCLARKNSSMLRDYSNIDKRVRVLGYCIKVFAKLCGIGDASRGSLSSYAYILLMLYYLQRCEPPVIPVLQELHDHSKEKPISMIEGWNTWYYDDINNLSNVWQGYNKNKQSVGELWLGFFVFYAETFDFNKNVVSIKQLNTLSKSAKNWVRSTMAIEDPYDLKHNLGAGVNRDMFKYFIDCFQNAQSHFSTLDPKLEGSREHGTEELLMDYFFDCEKFTDNQPVPKDGLCYRCGKVGHAASNCVKILAAVEQNIGCKKRGHYVANCPEDLENESPSLSQDGLSKVQACSDFDPQENIDLVLARSEMTLRGGDSRQRFRDKGKKLRMKAGNL